MAGYAGAAWTTLGLAVLNLPEDTLIAARDKLNSELAGLAKKNSYEIQECEDDLITIRLQQELDCFFSGKPTEFTVPVDWNFCTPFQKKVLNIVKSIPWGELRSYGEIASVIGQPQASRAVGGALGSNRILLVIPCHRVIRQDGTPGGFGSGLQWKQRLLELEGIKLSTFRNV